MSRTLGLRRQHDAAVAIVGEIEALLPRLLAEREREAASAITMLMARLTGLLRIHFAQEDKVLYPSLMAGGVGEVAAVARRFFAEMGTVGPIYMDFATRWASADAVLADAPGFRAASAAVFAALADRIRRENDELYVLADEVSAGLRAA